MINRLTKDLGVISKLPDLPNDEGGLTADDLKAKFDEAGLEIQKWINEEFLPKWRADQLPFEQTPYVSGSNVQAAIVNLQKQIADAAGAKIIDGSVGKSALTEDLLERVYGGRPYVAMDVPTSSDNPSKDFPIGQLWVRPSFSIPNAALDKTWTASNCTVSGKNSGTVTVTGDKSSKTAQITMTLSNVGNDGDRVLVYTINDSIGSKIQSLKISVTGDEERNLGTGVYYAVANSGNVSITVTATWESASLADDSFTIAVTAVNTDAAEREVTDCKPYKNWAKFMSDRGFFKTFSASLYIYVQNAPGKWTRFYQPTLPVTGGGTGLSSVKAGAMLYASNDDKLAQLAAPKENSVLFYENGFPTLKNVETVRGIFGVHDITIGSYTGDGCKTGEKTGGSRTIELPSGTRAVLIAEKNAPESVAVFFEASEMSRWKDHNDSSNNTFRITETLKIVDHSLVFSYSVNKIGGNGTQVTMPTTGYMSLWNEIDKDYLYLAFVGGNVNGNV